MKAIFKISYVVTVILMGAAISNSARADDIPPCSLTPRAINDLATNTVKETHARKEYMANTMVLRNVVDLDFGNDDEFVEADSPKNFYVEGFWRPKKDDFYTIGPAPIIGVDLQRGNNLVYVCAIGGIKPENYNVVIYFLHGYGLRRKGVTNFFEEVFDGQYLKIAPLHVDAADIGPILHFFSRLFSKVPLFNIALATVSDVEGDIAQAISAVSGAGVERITFTPEAIELANGVDLNDPTKTRTHVTIDLKKK